MRIYDDTCHTAGCNNPTTHTLTMRVVFNTDGMEPVVTEIGYCLKDALYFAAWLPYCYPGEQELISITPPCSELFENN